MKNALDIAFDDIGKAMIVAERECRVAPAQIAAERHGLLQQDGGATAQTVWERAAENGTLRFRFGCYDDSDNSSNIMILELQVGAGVTRRIERRYKASSSQ